ncbi:MAG: MMPL family transporter [Myxococcales bacterium]|nr:MMPL family transporter [Myxococcales bacterium]
MLKRFLDRLAALLDRRLKTAWLIVALLVGLSTYATTRLHISSNGIALLPQDDPGIKEVYRVTEMLGGIGFLMVALKANDEKHIKGVADDLNALLLKMPEVRDVTYKVSTEFVRKNIGLYIETKDLVEARRRIKKKIKAVIRKANPFHISLSKKKEVKLDLSDLIDKYSKMGKKGITDDYYITRDKKMLLLLIKPRGHSTDLEFTRRLVKKVDEKLAWYSKHNKRGAVLKEAYRKLAKGATVTYGYTGGYKVNLDDRDSIIKSLAPTSGVALGGILILLVIFLRRLSLVLSLTASLVAGVILTFGFCYITVGELNTITAILAGILMGQGIDFGIHFIYRLREEYTDQGDLVAAIRESMAHSGAAAATTAATTSAAFFCVAISDFRGFRDFGIVAGGGTIIIAMSMYVLTALMLLALARVAPNLIKKVLTVKKLASERDAKAAAAARAEAGDNKGGAAPVFGWGRIPGARGILVVGLLLTAAMVVTGTGGGPLKEMLPKKLRRGVTFDYDARSLMVKDRPSIILQQEIKERFQISADPAAVVTDTLDEAKKIYDYFTPLDTKKYSMIDTVISVHMFVPPMERQKANAEVLRKMQKDFKPLKPGMIENKKLKKHYPKLKEALAAKPFQLEDVPAQLRNSFANVPESKIKGYLTFIYPKVALWDGRDLLRFADQVGTMKIGGKTYHATGMAIVMATLARIVLHDGPIFTVMALIAILLIIMVDLRSVSAALLAVVPLLMGVSWMLGTMALIGKHINFMNVVVFPVVLGYGIGNGLYIVHRFRETGSVTLTMRRTGRAVLASCVTTLAGWGALLFANHLGLESMGVLASIGIACVLVTSLTVLPAALQVVEDRRTRKEKGSKQAKKEGQPA